MPLTFWVDPKMLQDPNTSGIHTITVNYTFFRTLEDAAKSDTAAFGRFHRAMMEEGVWLPPSQFEAAFVGLAHGKDEVERTIAAARKAFAAG